MPDYYTRNEQERADKVATKPRREFVNHADRRGPIQPARVVPD